jgi:hypothetical protein
LQFLNLLRAGAVGYIAYRAGFFNRLFADARAANTAVAGVGNATSQSIGWLSAAPATEFKTAHVAGLRLFYREAGDPSKPTIVLLHGFPSSSYQFHNYAIIRYNKYLIENSGKQNAMI